MNKDFDIIKGWKRYNPQDWVLMVFWIWVEIYSGCHILAGDNTKNEYFALWPDINEIKHLRKKNHFNILCSN